MTHEKYMKFQFQCPYKVLLERSHTHLFTYCLELGGCHRDCTTSKAQKYFPSGSFTEKAYHPLF